MEAGLECMQSMYKWGLILIFTFLGIFLVIGIININEPTEEEIHQHKMDSLQHRIDSLEKLVYPEKFIN